MKNQTLIRILVILAVYLGLRYFGGAIGAKILYPFTLLVTYLHEFGHALGAILTGGKVNALQINSDGSRLYRDNGWFEGRNSDGWIYRFCFIGEFTILYWGQETSIVSVCNQCPSFANDHQRYLLVQLPVYNRYPDCIWSGTLFFSQQNPF